LSSGTGGLGFRVTRECTGTKGLDYICLKKVFVTPKILCLRGCTTSL